VYDHPSTSFVATFLGKTNLFDAQLEPGTNGTAIVATRGHRFPIAAPSSGFATPTTNTPTWSACFGVRLRTVSFR
ncbi:hypothetical protein SB778_46155, partial [Paraburkholderia sp. SIMBA_050]